MTAAAAQPRFRAIRSLGGAWFFEDGLDGSRVALVFRGKRAGEKTAAMVRVMIDALNLAGTPKKRP